MMFDPLRVGLFAELLQSVPEEMGHVLERSSFSPNIKERRDYSCAVFSATGDLIAQAAHIPVHLGAMEFLIKRWLSEGPSIEPGKAYVSNDPYFAGTHLPDVTVLHRVDSGEKLLGYVASRAHHSDIGGNSPGSFAPTDHIDEEGVMISPCELTSAKLHEIAEATRQPQQRYADLNAQIAANLTGIKRLCALANRFGDDLQNIIEEGLEYAAAQTLRAIQNIPPGRYAATDFLEDVPHIGNQTKISVEISVSDSEIIFDFTNSDPQVPMGVNATEAVTTSACCYIVRCLAPVQFTNAGCWRNVKVLTKPGTIVCASYPAPVVAGNTETSQRIVDVLLQAMSKAIPNIIPACSQGTMNNVAFGTDEWAYYETIGGGCGAGPNRDGASGVHSHMTNTRNTPVEAIEMELPLRVTRYEIRENSGGVGLHRGGEGVVREYEVLKDGVSATIMSERRKTPPPGAYGGEPAAPGENTLISESKQTKLDSKLITNLRAGDRVRIKTPGGGGWGKQT